MAHVDASELSVDPHGRLEVVFSAREHEGNWIRLTPDTTTLIVRQTMNDPEREIPGELQIERIDAAGPPPPLRAARVAKGLSRAAAQVIGSAKIFADLSDEWARHPNVLHPSDVEMAEESFGDPDLYCVGGYWRLEPDEALEIEFTPPECHYWGFLLCNYWTESLEYSYRPVSTNKHRAVYQSDGSVRIVVAHRDPGLPDANWIDTEGHREGTMTLRWLLAKETPVPTPRVIRFDELAGS